MKKLCLLIVGVILSVTLIGCGGSSDEILSEAVPAAIAKLADKRDINFVTEDVTITSIEYLMIELSATQDEMTYEGYVLLFLIAYTRSDYDLYAYISYNDLTNTSSETDETHTSYISERESDYLNDVETYLDEHGMIGEDAVVNKYETTQSELTSDEIDEYLTLYLDSLD